MQGKLALVLIGLLGQVLSVEQPAAAGERLYNGIVLPDAWPPREHSSKSVEPMHVPYLQNPPASISIDVGRQLFVDDFLIESTDLKRTYYSAEKYGGNPVLRAETPAELMPCHGTPGHWDDGQEAVCCLGHGGAFFDPADGQFKMWYAAGWHGALALATSPDGLRWERPRTGLLADNLILPAGRERKAAGDANCFWLDSDTAIPAERLKYMSLHRGGGGHHLRTSSDAQTWSAPVPTGKAGDLSGFFYNPFRKVWVYSVKRENARGRYRDYAENALFQSEGVFDKSVYWTGTDRLDRPDADIGDLPQLYTLCGVAYESLLLGTFCLHYGPENRVCHAGKFPKTTDLQLGYSRDGFHWHRPDRRAFIAATRREGDWDRGYIRGPAGICFVAGDKLVFPYTGFSGVAPSGARGMYCGGAIGLAMLRRDGFASLDAGSIAGEVLTRPLMFSGRRLFVNVECPRGELRVELVDESGRPIQPFTLENCQPISADRTLQAVQWRGAMDLPKLGQEPVRLRFRMKQGSLFAFWVSRDASGASNGYLAGGGPGNVGSVDTAGTAAD